MNAALTNDEASKLRTASRSMHRISYDRIKSDLYRQDILSRFNGQKIIDLGSGTGWYLHLFFEAGCRELVVVEPKPKQELINKLKEMNSQGQRVSLENDAYNFWSKHPDESAIVTSYGVFDESIIGGCRSILIDDSDLDKISDKYFRVTAKEIERVTPTEQITIHRGPLAYLIKEHTQRFQPYSGDDIHTDWRKSDGGILIKQ